MKKPVLAILTAFFVAMAVRITSVSASSAYFISEYSTYFSQAGTLYLYNPCPSGWSCHDSNAKWYYLGYTNTGTWTAGAAGTTKKTMSWYAYIPNDYAGYDTFGAVKYKTHSSDETYYTTVNQSGRKGSWVYMGYLNHGDKYSYMSLPCGCVPGYSCSSSLKVMYDKAEFIY